MNNLDKITNHTNIKLTNARKAILEILVESNRPLSYEDIKDNLSMDKATFYRNIAKFEEEKIVYSFESNDKKRYFEMQKSQHSHFICTNCSKIECIHQDFNLNLENHKISTIIIKGLCPNCI